MKGGGPGSNDALHVFVDSFAAGLLLRGPAGELSFTYDDDYRYTDSVTPLSLSMPLVRRTHTGAGVHAFCENLLPDSTAVRGRWAQRYQTSDNAYDLLTYVGEDCAGAVQFVRSDRVEDLDDGGIDPLTDDDIAQRIAELRTDPSSWLPEFEHGQFSLAGAQSKFALHFDGSGWGLPYGSVPMTHIIKPAAPAFADHEVNEHLTLTLSGALGLPTARSQIMTFAGERAVVVERYDRVVTADGTVRRIHQEDCCQALGVMPTKKYENQGGPGVAAIVDILGRSDDPVVDVSRFVDALVFNWIVANTDAHAKNFSLLLHGPSVRLAPLYDLASWVLYLTDDPFAKGPGALRAAQLKSAMRLGTAYLLADVDRHAWEAVGDIVGADGVADRAGELCARVAERVTAVCENSGVSGETVEKYAMKIERRARLLGHVLAGTVYRQR